MTILEKIDKLRLEKGWSVNMLATKANLTQSTLNNLYTRHSDPKISTLTAICKALNVTLSDFFKETDTVDDELSRRINELTDENKRALLGLLRKYK